MMTSKQCCRTCRHCIFAKTANYGWCRLRQIKFHPDITALAFCQHWTHKELDLPSFAEVNSDDVLQKQLNFEPSLVSSLNS